MAAIRNPVFIPAIIICIVCCAIESTAQSVWHFKSQSITVTENGVSRVAIFRDSTNTAARTQTSCPPNIDFEGGNFSNWQCYTGKAALIGGVNTVNNLVATSPIGNRHGIISASSPALDPYGAFPTLCPNGSGYSVKLGNATTGSDAERIRYTFTVPVGQNDFNVVYNYAVVFQNPQSNHSEAQQPRFQARIYDAATGNGIACANYDFIATAGLPGFQVSTCTTCTPSSTVANPILYKNWTPVMINLSGFAGKSMILEFTTEDCTIGGHFGYAYVDVNSNCSGLVSGATYCPGLDSVVLNAPPGYQYYTWYNEDFSQVLGTGTKLVLSPPPPLNAVVNIDLVPYPGFGCRDTVFTNITVNSKPVPGFNVDTTPVCIKGNQFSFSSTTTGAAPLSYLWRFGDGATSTATNPSHSFTAAGTYPVKLVATSVAGCKDSTIKTVTVVPNPVATFDITTPSGQCLKSNSFGFQNTSSATVAQTYTWRLGDGTLSTQQAITHSYTAAGSYPVKLIARQNSDACADSITKVVEVYKNPGAGFTVNNPVQCLDANSFVFGNAPTGSGYQYQWNFGDGNTLNQSTATHSYTSFNDFPVRLIVTSPATPSLGCSDTTSQLVKVLPVPAGVIFNKGTYNICEGAVKTLNGTGGIAYQWFMNGTVIPGATSASLDATREGTYTLQVTNTQGCKGMSPDTAFVREIKKPVADFNWQSHCVNKLVQFTNSTSPGANNTVKYLWNFGMPGALNTDTATNPTRTYFPANVYKVRLTASSQLCPDTSFIEKSVRIENPPQGERYPAFNAAVNETYTLTARTGGVQYQWIPATDLTNANTRTPQLRATAQRDYLIHITTPSGCQATDSVRVLIFNNSEILVPKAFTPNRDGLNDVLFPILVGAKELKYFRVYNRWGNLVFSGSSDKVGWDGFYKGILQPSDTYTWVAEGIDHSGKIIRSGGNTILIR